VLSAEGLAREFGCDLKPDVFILLILAHGEEDGKILTDSQDYFFTTFQVWEALKSNVLLKDAVKINFFGVGSGPKFFSTNVCTIIRHKISAMSRKRR
jgi:hypothetical protein